MRESRIEEGMKFVILEGFLFTDLRTMLASHSKEFLEEATSYYERIRTDWNTVRMKYNWHHYDYFEKTGKTLPSMDVDNFHKLAKRFLTRKQYRRLNKAFYKFSKMTEEKVVVEMISAEMKLTDENGNTANF